MLVSARPGNLKTFVEDCREITQQATTDVGALRGSWDAFAAAPNEYGPLDSGVMGAAGGDAGATAYLLGTWSNDETFVELVQHAFEKSDVSGGTRKVTIGSWRVDAEMKWEADRRGIDLSQLTADRQNFTIPDPQIAPVPYTSGFTNDPVCTATGNFVEVEADLAMPERLAVLAWPRVYSSRLAVSGGHGRGWGCWASARCELQDDGALAYTGPDGQELTFLANRTGGWKRQPWIAAEATASPTVARGVTLRWDWASDRAGERWDFAPEGRLVSVWGPTTGTTEFDHDPAGRLARIIHEGGRSLDLHWEGGRIERLTTSCGRQVRFRYDDEGDLVEVEGSPDPRQYDLDADGRIVAVWDADRVRLCHNVYDDEGRILRQVSPFGRETIFGYLPGRVTLVTDTEDGPEARWEHDRYGRLIALVNDDGQRLSRTFDDMGRCVAVTGFDGATVTNRFDEAGRVVGARHSTGGEERFDRDDLDRVLRYERGDGVGIDFEYTGDSTMPSRLSGPEGWELQIDAVDGVIRGVTDADGVTMRFDHDADGNQVAVHDGIGNTILTPRHASGQLAGLVLPDGSEYSVERDDAGRPLTITLPTGEQLRLRWTAAGRLTEYVQADGSVVSIEYGDSGAERTITDVLGRVVECRHDHLARLVGVSTGDGRKWEWSYTAMGLLSAEYDPAGQVWLFDYDCEGRRTVDTNPLGERTAYRYDPSGALTEIVDPTGATTRFQRDALGRVAAEIGPDGSRTGFRYDGLGRPIAVVAPDSGVAHIRYTPAGRLAEVISAEGRGVRYVYDRAGRPAEVTDAKGGTARYEWDPLGRVAGITSAEGREHRFTYDTMGRPVAVEAGGFTWTATYDHAGLVTSRTDPLGATRRFEYDAGGHLVAATDPLGTVTRYVWDDDDCCVAVVDALGGTTRFEHDERGMLVAETDALGHCVRHRRDAVGRVVTRELPTGQRVDYRYDAAGRVRDVSVDGRDVVVQDLDVFGRPSVIFEPAANRTHRLTWAPSGRLEHVDTDGDAFDWRYDADGLLVERSVGGTPTTYRYDAHGLLVGQSDDPALTIDLVRDADGRLVALGAPGLDLEYRYDGAGRVAERIVRRDAQVEHVRFTYDAVGRISAVDTDGAITEYRYDAAGQLIEADGPAGLWRFRYDALGRLVAEDRPDGRCGYSYDAAHRLLAIDGIGEATFTHDESGRRTEQSDRAGDTRYGWDGLGRLAWIERSGERVRLDIDAFSALVGVDDVRLRWDSTADVAELVSIDDRRLVTGAGMNLGVTGASGTTWFGADWRGSVRPTDPFGFSEGENGVTPGFLGELGISGLVWLRNRVYDPSARQFLSRDPIAGWPGTSVANHPYHYAANDPINMVDPLGLSNQPVSIEEYQQYKKEATGFQWANCAVVVAGIVGTALIFTPLGPLALAGISAGLGMGVNMARQVGDQGRSFDQIDWGQQLRAGVGSAIFGGLGGVVGRPMAGFFTAGASKVVGPTAGRVVGTSAAGGSFGTFSQAMQEGYDASGLPGSDGKFDTSWVALSGAFGLIGGGVGGVRPPAPAGSPNLGFGPSSRLVGATLVPPAAGIGIALASPGNPDVPGAPALPGLPQGPPSSFPMQPPHTHPLDPDYSAPGLKPILNPISGGGTHCR